MIYITDSPHTTATGEVPLRVKKLSEHAQIPVRGTPRAAGYDLFSAYETLIPAQGKALVKTDIAIAVPEDCYGRIGMCGFALRCVGKKMRMYTLKRVGAREGALRVALCACAYA